MLQRESTVLERAFKLIHPVHPGVQSSRQNLPADSRPDLSLRLSNNEIDEHLSDIDGAFDTLHKGPFSLLVFPQDTAIKPEQSEQQTDTRLPIRKGAISSTDPTVMGGATETSVATTEKGPSHEDTILQTQKQTHPSEHSLPMGLSLLKLRPREQRLFDRYINYVTEGLFPLAGFVCSAYGGIVPAMVVSSQTTPHSAPHANAAVFHGVLSVAAASLSIESTSPGLEALHHQTLTLEHLRQGIEEGSDAHLPLAVAIMLLLLFQHLSGRDHDYRAHMQAGLRCLVVAAQRDSRNRTVTAISEQFLVGCALGNVMPEVRLDELQRQAEDGRRWDFEAQAGIEAGMVDIIIEINGINQAGGYVPRDRAERLRKRIASCKPVEDMEQTEKADGKQPNSGLAVLLLSAMELYFLRGVQKLEAQHLDVLRLMERGLGELEGIKPTRETMINCVVAWVGFLLGSECVLEEHQARFMAWAQSMARCPSGDARGKQNAEAMIMVAKCSWGMKREAPETYRLLWYQLDRGGDDIVLDGKTEKEDSPDRLALIRPYVEESDREVVSK